MTVTGPTSLAFFGWLVGTVALYWIIPMRARPFVPTAATVAFLALVDPRSLGLLSVMALMVIGAAQIHGRWRAVGLLGSSFLIILVLVLFKVLVPPTELSASDQILFPLGLSFYTFRCVHVLIEVYLEEIRDLSPVGLIHYLFFLPVIAAGPIHRYPAFAAEHDPTVNWANVSEGLERILYGYAKIVFIGNYVITQKLFPYLMQRLETDSALYQYLDCLKTGLNLYFQFAGYSDIAIGFALLLGHRIIENFDNPLIRTNIGAFWRCWHISLSSWCREYVFAGTYALSRQRWLGVLMTMIAIGLWHGITWNFLAWGFYHGCGILIWQQSQKLRLSERLGIRPPEVVRQSIGWILTFNFVMLSFALTKEPDLLSALEVYRIIFAGVVSIV